MSAPPNHVDTSWRRPAFDQRRRSRRAIRVGRPVHGGGRDRGAARPAVRARPAQPVRAARRRSAGSCSWPGRRVLVAAGRRHAAGAAGVAVRGGPRGGAAHRRGHGRAPGDPRPRADRRHAVQRALVQRLRGPRRRQGARRPHPRRAARRRRAARGGPALRRQARPADRAAGLPAALVGRRGRGRRQRRHRRGRRTAGRRVVQGRPQHLDVPGRPDHRRHPRRAEGRRVPLGGPRARRGARMARRHGAAAHLVRGPHPGDRRGRLQRHPRPLHAPRRHGGLRRRGRPARRRAGPRPGAPPPAPGSSARRSTTCWPPSGIEAESFRVVDLPGSDHHAILTTLACPDPGSAEVRHVVAGPLGERPRRAAGELLDLPGHRLRRSRRTRPDRRRSPRPAPAGTRRPAPAPLRRAASASKRSAPAERGPDGGQLLDLAELLAAPSGGACRLRARRRAGSAPRRRRGRPRARAPGGRRGGTSAGRPRPGSATPTPACWRRTRSTRRNVARARRRRHQPLDVARASPGSCRRRTQRAPGSSGTPYAER